MTGPPGFVIGDALRLPFLVSAEEQLAFAKLSGDHNAIHLDAGIARARGLDGSVVYGGLLVAKISRVVGMHWPAEKGLWASLDIRFRKPLLVGEEAVLCATMEDFSPVTGGLTIKVVIESHETKIATGTILAVLFPEAAPVR